MRKAPQNRAKCTEGISAGAVDGNPGGGIETLVSLAGWKEAKRRRGRRPRHDPEFTLEWRDRLVSFLENNWPELKPSFRRARNSEGIARALEPYRQYDPVPYLLHHKRVLFDFLNSGRYHGDPRQIANAMAAVDTLSWRRSFDLCGAVKNQCPVAVGERAWRDYMDRKFHGRFLLLRRAEKLPEADAIRPISAIMRGTRTHDENVRYYRKRPEDVLRRMRAGLPVENPAGAS